MLEKHTYLAILKLGYLAVLLSPCVTQCFHFTMWTILTLAQTLYMQKISGPVSRKVGFLGFFFWDLCIFLWYLPSQHGLEFWISYGCRCLEFPISPCTGEKSQLVWIFLRRSSTLSLLLERSLDVTLQKLFSPPTWRQSKSWVNQQQKMPTSISGICQSV